MLVKAEGWVEIKQKQHEKGETKKALRITRS